MPSQKFEPDAEKKKKIKQLEKDIKLMQKDMKKTFAGTEPKNPLRPIYIGIGVLVVCVIILAAVYFYMNSLF